MTRIGRSMCRFASAFFLKAPVSWSAMRKSEAFLTPRMRLFFIVMSVGFPARAAVDAQRPSPCEVQVQHVEEVFVPPYGDAVLGDAAEARQGALVETAEERLRIADQLRRACVRAGELLGERLDLQAVDRDYREAFVQEVVGDGVAGGAEPYDENLLAVVRERVRAGRVERVPACEERPDLESPGHRED